MVGRGMDIFLVRWCLGTQQFWHGVGGWVLLPPASLGGLPADQQPMGSPTGFMQAGKLGCRLETRQVDTSPLGPLLPRPWRHAHRHTRD